ncbi:uncharacterized protein K460DRAFT_271349 [Cucurbitaria berberidis CBS 394.84]|uniref:Mid2 domain-containing protein n=1 Tax=Cucurbitaria berberidis CBS 394.84 TaxID=1168544 RepID=A0A9P4GRP6_9PLEO|nr:uncharacterized protein K460DRAFT_271349 [Cucurbitaria berberidis CBS 394.84]KAF1850107.1 hypothetical protein K460DRAFT_271349 [Cucurbitaria berberidis CBS 394.84]
MAFLRALSLLYLFTFISLTTAVTPLQPSIRIRNAPGTDSSDTYLSVKHGLAAASLTKRKGFKAQLPLEKSWNGATLLSIQLTQDIPQNRQNKSLEVRAGIEITCMTCYVRGLATAELTIGEKFNASQALAATTSSVRDNVNNFTMTFEDYLANYTGQVLRKFGDGFDWADLEFPTFPFTFDLDVPEIPECKIQIQFDGMELYMELNTFLNVGATYEINLYATQTPIGIKVGPILQLGVVLSVDLILTVDGAIDISSGFHIKLDDGVAMDITLFGDKVSSMIFNGGQFEFLPVTVKSAGVAISAVLRVGVHCGIEVTSPKTPSLQALGPQLGLPKVTAGIEVAVFAHVAEFITNVTYNPKDKDCALIAIQEYNFALGAVAGATVLVDAPAIENMTWGPVIEASTAIFTTTLAEVCASQGTTTTTPASVTAVPQRRKDLTTTTISTVISTSGVRCMLTGVANCPASAQSTTKTKFTKTLVTAVPSGVKATFPESILSSVQSTIRFGTRAKTIKATSGSPTAYTAPPTSTDDVLESGSGLPGGQLHGVRKQMVVGVSVGLGVPVLLALIGAILIYRRRNKEYDAVTTTIPVMVADPYIGNNDDATELKKPGVESTEIRSY